MKEQNDNVCEQSSDISMVGLLYIGKGFVLVVPIMHCLFWLVILLSSDNVQTVKFLDIEI